MSALLRVPAWAVAALGAALVVALEPPSADLAAAIYRADLFERIGVGVWNNGWYAGHHTPAYSVVYPPLAAALGVRLPAALAVVAGTWLFARLAERHWDGDRARAAALWFAVALVGSLLSGRLPFTLGVAAGVGALVALQAGRLAIATAVAFVVPLASAVAALFLAMAAVAWGLADRERRAVPAVLVTAAALGPALVLAALFPEGGTEPFVASAFWPGLVGVVVLGLLLPPQERALRIGAALYALGWIATGILETPLGGNVTRFGTLVAGPVLLGAVAGRRPTALVVALAIPFAYWVAYPAVRDVTRASGDPSVDADYYTPLLAAIDRETAGEDEDATGGFRVEIPFTENHWEAARVAPRFPLARGWQRQLDRKHADLFYDAPLTPATYRAWLDAHAVRFVAVPDVPLDAAGDEEAALVAAGVPYLDRVWEGEHWTLHEVADPAPLLEGVPGTARLTAGEEVTIHARGTGDALLRVRHTRWWRVVGGDGAACVEKGDDGFTRLRIGEAGRIVLAARLTGDRCG